MTGLYTSNLRITLLYTGVCLLWVLIQSMHS